MVGLTYDQAKAILDQQGFLVNRSESYSDDVPKGMVIRQSPEAKRNVTKGSAVVLVVSLGEDKVRVPNVIGFTLDQATQELTDAGILVGSIEEEYNEIVEPGRVFYQNYSEGSYIEKREQVSLKVSKGSKPAAYSYKANIEAPSLTEAPQYQNGDVVDVSLVTSMGKILLSTSTSTFPISVDYAGISSSSGTITMTYYYEEVITPATDTTPAVTEKRARSFTRAVSFTEE